MKRRARLEIIGGLAILGIAGLALSEGRDAAHGNLPDFRPPEVTGQLSVMTYNVEGLPWPIRLGRSAALAEIGLRLASLRQSGHQPHLVLLQEAFSDDAEQIRQTAGYRFSASGPDAQELGAIATSVQEIGFEADGSLLKGERSGKWIGSGLLILSDYPILAVRRAGFPRFACAGFDCLANKGVVLAMIAIPNAPTPIAIVNTHLNSRRAAHVGFDRSLVAYRAQIDALATFLDRNVPPGTQLILGGDFNIGHDARRRSYFSLRLARWIGGLTSGAFGRCLADRSGCAPTMSSDAHYSLWRARDWQFARAGTNGLDIRAISVPFGRERDGSMLSDHVGYTVLYQFAPEHAALSAQSPKARAS